MKLTSAMVTATLAILGAGQAVACTAPAAPDSIPDGKSAAKAVMLAKMKEVDRYRRDVEVYLSCETNELRARTARAELERVANRFNAEVRAFKAANGG